MRLTRETFASETVALMGFEACAVLPAMLEGTLFVAGAYSALEYESVGAFTQSNPPFDDRICVPYVVRDLLYYQGLTYVLEDLHKRLALLPFVGSTVAEYLSIKKDTSGKGSYSERFLKYLDDLKVAAVEVKAAEDLLREIETHPSWSHFLDAPTTATTYRVRVPPLIRGSVIDIVTSEAGRALAHVRGDLTVGTDRQKSIGDYLRDAATSEATVVNLKLQRLVIVLTNRN